MIGQYEWNILEKYNELVNAHNEFHNMFTSEFNSTLTSHWTFHFPPSMMLVNSKTKTIGKNN